ncbi:MAG: GNAT family N-acetyltransferase [Planctomycetia bacterium]|nr:GNAT family N-acetyltransferase [Planctomycetia bacterium]
MSFKTRLMEEGDQSAVADLIYKSLNTWYLKNRGFELVSGPSDTMMVFPRVYEALDPHCCVLAEDTETGRIAGSCFFHPRPTHVSLGILNVHPDYFGKRVSSLLVKYVSSYAEEKSLPLRLVSSAMNLESFNLYNRYGFQPVIFFQDMVLEVPPEGVPNQIPSGMIIRKAVMEDVPAMVRLEKRLCKIDREKDFRFFIENREKIWRTSLLIDEKTGELEGFTASVLDPGSNMIGPGVAQTEMGMNALIRYELNAYPGKKPVWLIPSNALCLRKSMFEIGAQNCETHILQVQGEFYPPCGTVIPSFMPETF